MVRKGFVYVFGGHLSSPHYYIIITSVYAPFYYTCLHSLLRFLPIYYKRLKRAKGLLGGPNQTTMEEVVWPNLSFSDMYTCQVGFV